MRAIISAGILVFFFSPLHSQLWKQYEDSAKTFIANKNTDKAIAFYTKTLDGLKTDSMGTYTYARVCDSLGNLFSRKQRFMDAKKCYLDAKQIQENLLGKQNQDYAASCYYLGTLYLRIGRFDSAEAFSIEAKQIREKVLGKENTDYAASCSRLASIYFVKSQYDKAEPLFLEAMKIQEALLGKENQDYAGFCNNLANLYTITGNLPKAEDLYLEAMQIRGKVLGKEHPDYAQSCTNLGILYRYMNQYQKAESELLEGKQIREKVIGKQSLDYAASCGNLADLYAAMGEYTKAEPLYLEQNQIWEKILGRENAYFANTSSNLGVLYMKIGQYEKAEKIFLETKQIAERVSGKENRDYATHCYNLAELYKEMGQYQKAEPFYLEAKEIRQKELGKQHPDYGASCYELGNLYWVMHQPGLAEKEFNESFASFSYNLNSIFRFVNEKEKEEFVKDASQEDDKAYSFFLSEKSKSELPYALSLFRRNLILSYSQTLKKELFFANDSTVIAKYLDWLSLKKYLAVLYSRPIKDRKNDPAKIEDSIGLIEKELTEMSAGFKKQQIKVGWKDIRSKLKYNEASIEFASFHFYNGRRYTDTILYVGIVIRRDAPFPVMVKLFNEKKLSRLFASSGHKTARDGVQELYYTASLGTNGAVVSNKSIYDLIWKPLEPELKGISTVYFAPSGLLHRVSFAALQVNKDEVLSDKYHLVQLATTASVTDLKPAFITSSNSLKLFGGITYDARPAELKQAAGLYASNSKNEKSMSIPDDPDRSSPIRYLPGTRSEIEGIGRLANAAHYRATLISGVTATEESFKALDGKASPSVIHVATHGFFFPDPNAKQGNRFQRNSETSPTVWWQADDPMFRSGLLFAGANIAWQGKSIEGIDDGILTAYEVSNMYLPKTKLVVLSACETALGDIEGSEGVYGLQRAFKIAGVQNLVMSLWKVPDLATAEFMQQMYKNLFAGKSIGDAFYVAQTAMKNKYRSDPYKWAAWVLVR